MKSILSIVFLMLFYFQGKFDIRAQTPDLGTAATFAVFTSVGAFTNNGATIVTGDIGTNVGALTGFPPGIVVGSTHVADAISASVALEVEEAYNFVSAVSCGQVIGTSLGNAQILTPDVYCLGAASTLNGTLVLDGQSDPESTFIIKIEGALSTTMLSQVVLINEASVCNIYWHVNGAVHLGAGSSFVGTILANGEVNLLEGALLSGRALTRAGAVNLNNNTVEWDNPSCELSLPVDLLSFDYTILNCKTVQFNWVTANEVNHSHFVLQSSGSEMEWQSSGTVTSVDHSHSGLNYYSIRLNNVVSGNYFRLVQLDLGKSSKIYSNIRVINDCYSDELNLSPNPAASFVHINGQDELLGLKYYLYTVQGKIILQGEVSKNPIDLTNVPGGIYYMSVNGKIKKLIVSR